MRHLSHLALGLGLACVTTLCWADIRSTKHNLSSSGPGEVVATDERRICVFCHTPHRARAQAPMWNRNDSGQIYIKYWSPTLDAYGPGEAPEVDGTSRLCLSCHDGTVALGSVLQGGKIRMRPGAEYLPRRGQRARGDLSGSHPISFPVTEDLISRNNSKDLPLKPLAAMRADKDVKLDEKGKLQCTTCHDVHDDRYHGSSGVPFYRKPTWDGVCTVCHDY